MCVTSIQSSDYFGYLALEMTMTDRYVLLYKKISDCLGSESIWGSRDNREFER